MAQQHYFSETQSSKEIVKKIKTNILNHDFEFYTASGVFSADKIDTGTRILIENVIVREKDAVLDFGSGIGVVGIVIKKIFSQIKVYLTDINERAVNIARKNAELNNMDLIAFQGNLYESIPTELKFDTIISNLPQHAGRKTCFTIIEQSKNYLKHGGTLQVVARHQKGGKETEKKMLEVFGNVETLAKESGYRVYLSKNSN